MPGIRFDASLAVAAPAITRLCAPLADGMVRHDADRSDSGSVRQRYANVRQSVADESETVFEHVDKGMRDDLELTETGEPVNTVLCSGWR